MTQNEILDQIATSYQEILKGNLVGIYVHGSIAFDCFNWEKSDIDFLVVTKLSPSLQEKELLLEKLLQLDSECPPKGLEMSVVLEENCNNFVYPTPFELHFSNMHKEECKANLEAYCMRMNGIDRDLAAHFTVVREVGITLLGKDVKSVFGAVPKADYIDSIKWDIEEAVDEIKENPVSTILNLCRVLAYIKDGLVLSKKQGGQWGIDNLPTSYINIVEMAEHYYCNNKVLEINDDATQEFAKYMLNQIYEKV